MLLSDYSFELPESLIARYPAENRDDSRLLHYSLEKQILKHLNFKDICDYFEPGDILVRNVTKVMPARFRLSVNNHEGNSSEIEILLVEKLKNSKAERWKIMAKPAKKLKNLEFIEIKDIKIKVIKEQIEGKHFNYFLDFASSQDLQKLCHEYGEMPIPPYMKRKAEDLDKERYQTIYAKNSQQGSSVAAPTAGLHFTDEIFAQLKDKGVEILDLYLHVGMGTFAPIHSENIKEHKMHSEFYEISQENWQKIITAKSSAKRVIAIGTTSIRTLESVAKFHEDKGLNYLQEIDDELLQGSTNIFIYPGEQGEPSKFNIIDGMVTNFHLPESTLFLLISAFLGSKTAKEIYLEAIKEKYRFYSYGDACLFL